MSLGKHLVYWLVTAFLIVACINYPGWVNDGYLDGRYVEWLPIPLWFMVAIPCYGGLVAIIWHYTKTLKNYRK